MSSEPFNELEADLVKVGTRLRKLRKERGWRLEDLAERTKLSRPYLSRLESGERQPSLTALFSLAQAYGVQFSSLFESEPAAEKGVIVRANSNSVQKGNGLLYTHLSATSWVFNLQPLRVVVPAEREGSVLYKHEGEQWMHVLSGKLSLKLADEEFVLETGDSAHFDADTPHRLTALESRDAEIILVACAVPYLLLKSYL